MSRNWQRIPLAEVCEIQQGNNLAVSKLTGGEFPVYGANGIVGYFDDWNFDREVVALGCRGSCGTLHSIKKKAWLGNNVMAIWPKNDSIVDLGFIQLSLEVADLKSTGVISGQVQPQITRKSLSPLQIALPHLLEQRRIVDIVSSVDSYITALQRQADAARVARSAVLSELLSAGGDDWIETTLGDVAEWYSGGTPKAGKSEYYDGGDIPWVVIADLLKTEIYETATCITPAGLAEIGGRLAPVGSVLISMYATVGRPGITHVPVATNQAIAWSVPKTELVLPRFLLLIAQSLEDEISSMARGATQRNINRAMLRKFTFQLPPIEEQRQIVAVVSSMDEVIQSADKVVANAKSLRSGLLSDLLSGSHEIPDSYDRLLGVA